MKRSVTIIISHFESVNFLHAAIKQIKKFKNENITQRIIVADQSSKETFWGIEKSYDWDTDVEVVWIREQLWSGHGIDYLMRYWNIRTDYICQLHADAFPISHSWLSLPITLMEENNLEFAGQLHFIADGTHSIYPPVKFFSMSPTFNVGRTATYKEMSLHGGFTRFHNRGACGFQFLNDDWDKWAWEDYQNRGSDDDTVAFCWEDKYRQHDKLGLAITGFIEPAFGRLIEDIVFHFGSANESKGVINQMSERYREFTKK